MNERNSKINSNGTILYIIIFILYNITIVYNQMEDQDKESDIHILFEGALHEKIGVK